ncbi:MAG TPA: GNAT family N-acetyltransferase [Actinomycetota bacterium]|nr:GNAT family N-acetyltransferase [Actinomycetota bacterium]
MGDAWDLAHRTAEAAGVELRELTTLEDADRILEVMIATWGEHQLLPRELIRALMHSGNAPWGAFEGPRMVGYVLGFLGREGDLPHVHSHMLAVRPEHRSRGVGYALKLAQRAAALDLGVEVVRWTFDPLLSKNAYFNLAKLGAVCDAFHRNFYGEMTDLLNRGERSDRLVVRWELTAEPSGPAEERGAVVLDREGPEDRPRPAPGDPPQTGPALVRIPRDYQALRERDRALALAWREASAAAIESCLRAGLIARGFSLGSTYVFA